MDLMFITSLFILLFVFIMIFIRIFMLWRDESQSRRRAAAFAAMRGQGQENEPAAETEGGNRPPLVVGGVRRVRQRRPIRHNDGDDLPPNDRRSDDSVGEEDDLDALIGSVDTKLGKKKQAKLEAKAGKKAMREAEMADREDRKRTQAEREAKENEEKEKEKQKEAAIEAQAKREREEKERQEHEEYVKMKEMFSVEEEGYDELNEDQENDLLQRFVSYVQEHKVVSMDELAAAFNMKSADAVDRLKALLEQGALTGLIDDRGKFIYITPDELQSVAKFIKQRGRVSISELADYSNKLIKLDTQRIQAQT